MRWERGYPPEDESATASRKDATAALTKAGVDGPVLEDVRLVIGELVSNAIRHAATDLVLTLVVGEGRVRVEVFDADTRPPALLAAGTDATSGRGLMIVASAAERWGFEGAERRGMTGKVVWAELTHTREDRDAESGPARA